MSLPDPCCTSCGRASVVLVTVELSGRSTTTKDPITTLRLCRRCYRVGGYEEQPTKERPNG